jgi:hypothetical protein
MTGIDYPTISVGEHKDLTVRFSLAAQLLMRRRGIDPGNIGQACAPRKTIENPNRRLQSDPLTITIANPDCVGNLITVFSCCVAENFIDLKQPTRVDLNAAPTADYWATQIDDVAEIDKVVGAAMGKWSEERRKTLAPTPPVEAAS